MVIVTPTTTTPKTNFYNHYTSTTPGVTLQASTTPGVPRESSNRGGDVENTPGWESLCFCE
jgi:hypothetical protein